MLTNINELVETLVGEALEKRILDGEEIFWSVTMLPMNGTVQGFISVSMKGALIGSLIQTGLGMDNPALITEEGARDLAVRALTDLRAARTEQLANVAPDRTEAVESTHPGAVLLG